MKKFILPLVVIAVLFAMTLSVSPVLAGLQEGLTNLENLQGPSGLPEGDLYQTIAGIINILLGIIGLVLVVLIIYAGFLWMTARGDPKKVDTAKEIITNAIIGVLITILAYGIANFVLTQLIEIGTA